MCLVRTSVCVRIVGQPIYTTPQDLPGELYAAVYSDSDPPVDMQIVGLTALSKRLPMRSSHSSVTSSSSSGGLEKVLHITQTNHNQQCYRVCVRIDVCDHTR